MDRAQHSGHSLVKCLQVYDPVATRLRHSWRRAVRCARRRGGVGDNHSAQRQGHVHAAGEADVADAAAVRAAPARLQLVDDLHRPHLRSEYT